MKKALLILTLVLAAPLARATSITGNLAVAGLDHYGPTSITFINPATVLLATGSLSPMLTVPSVMLHNVTSFSTEPGKLLFDWNHAGVDIDMLIKTWTVVSDTSHFLNISGTALMSETGFDPTLYNFDFTSTAAGTTSFTMDVATVPESGTMFLMSLGLLLLAMLPKLRRRET